jgi:hypothetical protein
MSSDAAGAVDMVLVGQFFEAAQKDAELLRPALPEEIAADRQAAG